MRNHVVVMQATDMRSLSREARHERRVQVIRLRKAGRTYDEIAELTGLSRTGVFDICKRHEVGGAKALRDAPGGRRVGEKRLLSPEQEATVRKLIADKTPDQLKMVYALWMRQAVSELLRERFGIELPVRTMALYLSRWGFTPNGPMHRAYAQSPVAVTMMLHAHHPEIAEQSKFEGAEIHWGDETGLHSDDARGRSYAPGQTPVVKVNNKRRGLSIISTVTYRGTMRWKIFDGALNADILIDFMSRLVRDAERKVYLILDKQKVLHSKPVKAWLAEHQHEIEVFYLPSYSPARS
jgi:transposase